MAANPLAWIDDELDELQSAGLLRRLVAREGPQLPGAITIEGKQLCNFASNDYLGLAADQRLADAVTGVLGSTGWGSGASPLITGRALLHARLETELAEFEGTEAALLFQTGFGANVGTVASLVGRGDVVFSDAKNHASIIDGCRLSGATIRVYPHADVDALADLLRQADDCRRRLIVTDSLFSMDGDLAPLVELSQLAEERDAMLMVDEAHATGVFGKRGRGIAEHLGVEDGVHVRVGTLSKALGSMGGFVVGPQNLVDWLANRARTYIFSTAAPAAASAAAVAALQIVRDEPQRRVTLLERAAALRERLKSSGWKIGSTHSQIVPIVLGAPDRASRFSMRLREKGSLVPAIRPPTVSSGESLLRISLSYLHDDEMIQKLVSDLASLRDAAV